MESNKIDFSKPLLFQVGHLGDSYNKWVHQPRSSLETPRFFENKLLELSTRTIWWLLPIIWFPVAVYTQILSYQKGLQLHEIPLMMAIGILIWSLIEYLNHRLVFHAKTSSYWANTFHYLMHGYHHKHPMDKTRLVLPPTLSLTLTIPLYQGAKLIFPHHAFQSIYGGGVLGYLIYDLTHYYLHQGNPSNELLKKLKRIHLNHHYKSEAYNFGVSYPLWDFVFGTYKNEQGKSQDKSI